MLRPKILESSHVPSFLSTFNPQQTLSIILSKYASLPLLPPCSSILCLESFSAILIHFSASSLANFPSLLHTYDSDLIIPAVPKRLQWSTAAFSVLKNLKFLGWYTGAFTIYFNLSSLKVTVVFRTSPPLPCAFEHVAPYVWKTFDHARYGIKSTGFNIRLVGN